MDTSKTTSSADLDFTELFSCFDGAQSYFETDYVPAFHDLHNKFSQYPAKIARMKTYNVELKEKYKKELAAIEKRLSEMNAATEMWKVQCEDQQRRINELENEVIIRKNEGRELQKEYVKQLKQLGNMELGWLHTLEAVANNVVDGLNSKISLDLGEVGLAPLMPSDSASGKPSPSRDIDMK